MKGRHRVRATKAESQKSARRGEQTELREHGICHIHYDTSCLDKLREICTTCKVIQKAAKTKPGGVVVAEDYETGEEAAWRRGTVNGNTSGIFYLNADNEFALSLFQPLFDETGAAEAMRAAGVDSPEGISPDNIDVHSAQLIIIEDRSVRISKWHQDYACVEPHQMYSAITALFTIPEGAGGLEFKPWKPGSLEDGEPRCVKYDDGKLVIFDGRLTHRTEPYEHSEGTRVVAVMDCYAGQDHKSALCKVVGDNRGNGFSRFREA